MPDRGAARGGWCSLAKFKWDVGLTGLGCFIYIIVLFVLLLNATLLLMMMMVMVMVKSYNRVLQIGQVSSS
jgi:hypothetical protein